MPFSSSFYEAGITLIAKPGTDNTRKLETNLMNMEAKICNKNTRKLNPATYENNYMPEPIDIYTRNARLI